MGLEGVELIMDVEDEFKIAIADADAGNLTTVGELVDFVYSRLKHTAQEPCPSQHGFYIVRRQMMNLLGIQRSKIRLETKLENLISRTKRRKTWRYLIRSLSNQKTDWPSLCRPKWMVLVILTIPIMLCIYLVVFTHLSFILALYAAVALAIIGHIFTIPFQREFPSEFLRVQDLIKIVATLDTRILSKEDVFQKIKIIIIRQLGVKESEVTLDAKFVDDLGL